MEEDSGEEDGPDDDLDDIGISRSFPIILMYCIWFHLTTLSHLMTAGGGSRCHVSTREYYCFKLQIREGHSMCFFMLVGFSSNLQLICMSRLSECV